MNWSRVAILVPVSLVAALGFWSGSAPTASAQPHVTCQVGAAPLTAYPSSYNGICPAVITFKGVIVVEGRISPNNPCVVKYVFDRSDGATDSIERSMRFTEPAARAVSTTWTLGGAQLPHYVGWEAIHIRRPAPGRQWGHATFEMTCQIPEAKIVSVECAGGLTVNVHISINSLAGISSYKIWSTWLGGPEVQQTFVAPLPTHVDRVVTIAHSAPDPVDRDHQWGLRVEVPGMAAPILTYGMEPRGADGRQRCPGHYR